MTVPPAASALTAAPFPGNRRLDAFGAFPKNRKSPFFFLRSPVGGVRIL
jgi:hypothetical protein